MVLDEATSALDTLTENSVQDALDRLGSDRTVLVIAHRLGTIKDADNIIVLGDGKVAEEVSMIYVDNLLTGYVHQLSPDLVLDFVQMKIQGTHDELLEKGGKYAEMWNMQLHSTRSTNKGSTTSLTGLDMNGISVEEKGPV